ncbi:hypothetical protein BDV93DRAFT_528722 [Ceratobasidium sp. AG-I]|nr:hypothetical protein BDV93DRAFT_528722 [Ceratobasidium sp. AG-I]
MSSRRTPLDPPTTLSASIVLGLVLVHLSSSSARSSHSSTLRRPNPVHPDGPRSRHPFPHVDPVTHMLNCPAAYAARILAAPSNSRAYSPFSCLFSLPSQSNSRLPSPSDRCDLWDRRLKIRPNSSMIELACAVW